MKHILVHGAEGRFSAWPANNGLWSWDGSELLVGCVEGEYDPTAEFHLIRPPYHHLLLRSLDGGESWRTEVPQPFIADHEPQELAQELDFTQPDLALRVLGTGYHGSKEARGAFLASLDRGKNWQGPFWLRGLEAEPELAGLELTPRTDTLIEGPRAALFLLSARLPGTFLDRAFCARTPDGGRTFHFVSWITPSQDPYRAVMPATLRLDPNHLVSALRRRAVPADVCWIDAFHSLDGGQSWSLLSRVGETGPNNGNPPALARLRDGRLVCVYGRRDICQLVARLSQDEGRSWGEERCLRAGFSGRRPDFGYPRLAVRADGQLVTLYYWSSSEHPGQHIAATIWDADE